MMYVACPIQVITLCFYLQLFKYLNDVNQGSSDEEKDTGSLGISLYSSEIIDELSKNTSYTEKDLFKISQLLEGACFFQVYCPLAQIFLNSRQEYEKKHVHNRRGR